MGNQADLQTSDLHAASSVGRGSARKALRITVSAALLSYIFLHIGLQTVITAIGRANISVLSLAFIAALIVQFIASYQVKYLTDVQQLRLPTLLVFEVELATRFYGLFLPGGNVTALPIRILKFTSKRSQITGVVVSLFADRIIATLSLCGLGLVFWALARPQPDELWLRIFALATVVCLVPTYALFVRPFSPKVHQFAQPLRRHWPNVWEKLSYAFQSSRQSGGKVLISSLTLSVGAHLVSIVGYWLIAQSIGMALSLPVVAWIRSGMMLATLLPITFAGLGVREGAALVLLQRYGIDSDDAVAFSVLVFAATVVWIAFLGGLTEAWRFAHSRNR